MPADHRFASARLVQSVRFWFDKALNLEGPGAQARRLALALIEKVQASAAAAMYADTERAAAAHAIAEAQRAHSERTRRALLAQAAEPGIETPVAARKRRRAAGCGGAR